MNFPPLESSSGVRPAGIPCPLTCTGSIKTLASIRNANRNRPKPPLIKVASLTVLTRTVRKQTNQPAYRMRDFPHRGQKFTGLQLRSSCERLTSHSAQKSAHSAAQRRSPHAVRTNHHYTSMLRENSAS